MQYVLTLDDVDYRFLQQSQSLLELRPDFFYYMFHRPADIDLTKTNIQKN